MESFEEAWVKEWAPCYIAQWFLPYSGSLSGIPEQHGRGAEHKAGVPKHMQLPMT